MQIAFIILIISDISFNLEYGDEIQHPAKNGSGLASEHGKKRTLQIFIRGSLVSRRNLEVVVNLPADT